MGYIPYYVDNLQEVKQRLVELFNSIGIEPDYTLLDEKFYEAHTEYTAKNPTDVKDKEWASLELGLKIYECVKEQGDCSFEAEI